MPNWLVAKFLNFFSREQISAAKLFWCWLNLTTFSVCFCFQWMLKGNKKTAFHSPRSSTYIFIHGLKLIPFSFFNRIGLSLFSWCFIDAAYRAILMLNVAVLGNCTALRQFKQSTLIPAVKSAYVLIPASFNCCWINWVVPWLLYTKIMLQQEVSLLIVSLSSVFLSFQRWWEKASAPFLLGFVFFSCLWSLRWLFPDSA